MNSKLAMALVAGGVMTAGAGCMDSISEQTKKDPNVIIGKKTDDIGEFDPKAKREVSDSKVRVDDPILYPLQAYGPMVEQISKSHVEHALQLYEAEHGHYPRDHKEFMEGVIKPNQIQLPVLPAGAKYQYDVKNHKLVVVKAQPIPGTLGELEAQQNGANSAPAANPASQPDKN
jgi:hypothetical protein